MNARLARSRNHSAKWVIALLVTFMLQSAWCQTTNGGAGSNGPPLLTVEKLKQLMTNVPPWWTADSDYPARGWTDLIEAAKFIQSCYEPSVDRTFIDYAGEYPYRKARRYASDPAQSAKVIGAVVRNDSKLFLLMRVVFDVPEDKVLVAKFYPWHTPCDDVQASWPVTWQDGRPHLLTGSLGIEGIVDLYDISGEYRDFKKRYKLRDLSKVVPGGTFMPQAMPGYLQPPP